MFFLQKFYRKFLNISFILLISLVLINLTACSSKTEETPVAITNPNESQVEQFIEFANEGNIEKLKNYLNNGYDINQTFEGMNVLIGAAFGNKFEAVKFLVQHGADVNFIGKEGSSPALFALVYKNNEILQILIDNGLIINTTDYPNNMTLLMIAIRVDSLEGAKLLLANGAKETINHKMNDGFTALKLAKHEGKTHFIELLLENGAVEE